MSYDAIQPVDEQQCLLFRGYNCELDCFRHALFLSDSFTCDYVPPTTLDTTLIYCHFEHRGAKLNLSLWWSPIYQFTETDMVYWIIIQKNTFFLIVYNVNSRESFDVACQQLHALKTHDLSRARVLLIGSHCELPSVVDESEEVKVADKYGVPHIRVSSGTGFRVKELRDMIGDMVVRESFHNLDDMYGARNIPNDASTNQPRSRCLVM